jgi:hypothetical protein
MKIWSLNKHGQLNPIAIGLQRRHKRGPYICNGEIRVDLICTFTFLTFLTKLPIMAPIYETYITKHSTSTARLTALTTENPTPAMINYIEHTKAIASTHSNSWDLNSLLIKPIRRFLKYPLETLVMSTPDTHPDKPALI